MRASGYVGGLAIALGIGAALFAGQGVASAAPHTAGSGSSAHKPATSGKKATASSARRSAVPSHSPGQLGRSDRADALRGQIRRPSTRPATGHLTPATTGFSRARHESSTATNTSTLPATSEVSVNLPPMPVTKGLSFTVSPDFMKGFASDYVTAGGAPTDGAHFFFGDLAVASLDALAEEKIQPKQVHLLLGNLAASGYFGGIWLRDNLRDTSTAAVMSPPALTPAVDLTPSAIGIRLFDAVAAGLAGAAARANDWVVRTVAHASVPVLLALYGYNRGYLQVVLENPPAGVPSMQDTLACDGFLDCNSTAFPLQLANRYDSALGKLDNPTNLGWAEMAAWTTVLQSATSAGRFVWEGLARGGFSPASYTALVDLSSAYLMVSKAAALSSMTAYAGGDATVGRSSLRLQAGLWMWSGAYFAGLASGAGRGTMPKIVVT